MNTKLLPGLGLLILVGIALLAPASAIPPASVSITAGHSYVIELEGVMGTYRWGGIKYTSAGGSRSESKFPVEVIGINTPIIWNASIEIGTFNDDHHYFAAANIDEFDLTDLREDRKSVV